MMNFDYAVTAHMQWKQKLARYLLLRDDSLNPAEATRDDKCPLGQWIYGEGTKYASLPEYVALKSEHACFHEAVAEVIRRANAGKSVAEEIALGSQSRFGKASSAVVQSITRLKVHVEKKVL